MKVCFVLNDLKLSGGVGVVVSHAEYLALEHGFEVTLAMTGDHGADDWDFTPAKPVRVQPIADLHDTFDVAVATWWETAYELFGIKAHRYAYFVQSLEERFYGPASPERLGAAISHELPVALITEAHWIADVLEQLRPGVPCYYVRNGIDKDVFVSSNGANPRTDGPLRVLIEGHPDVWLKAVGEAAEAASRMTEPHVTTLVTPGGQASGIPVDRVVGPLSQSEMAALYTETDVLLKLSRVEGMFGPPLEAFHMGASCVVTPVTGYDEYVVHGWNGVVVDWDDPRGTARWLDLLARNRHFLHFLRHNAIHTAKGWPSKRQSSQFMASALARIASDPAPPPGPGMFGSVLAAGEDYRNRINAMQTKLNQRGSLKGRVKASRAYKNPVVRILLLPARLLYRLAKKVTGRG